MSDGAEAQGVRFLLDGVEVEAAPGETIWQVANRRGTEIPHLCYSPAPGYRADGNCRACMVEIEGERVLAASCIRKPDGRHEGADRERAGEGRRASWSSSCWSPTSPSARIAHDPELALLALGRHASASRASRFAPREHSRRPTAATRRWRSISTPASNAISASAPAARCR